VSTITPFGQKIDKRHLEATVFFAINNISQVDEATLERFLELVNTTGNFGSISEKQLVHKMDLLKKHVPDTCEYSLRALAELLGIHLPINKQH
jgi:DNA polymerase III epsilon subunit-like protein